MRTQSWQYASGLNVTLSGGKLQWESLRRGDEWGVEQTTEDFIANGPAVGFSDISKDTLREILTATGHSSAAWLPQRSEEKTLTLTVLGQPIKFIEDQWLKAHDNLGVHDIVARIGKTAEEFWRGKKLRAGYLAEDTHILQFVFKAGSELLLHENGNLFIGVLRVPAHVNGIEYAADTALIFHEDGSVNSHC